MSTQPRIPQDQLTCDQQAAERIYRHLLMHEFAFELRLGHHLAFMRAFASPRVAGLLSHTGEIARDPHRRGTDTGLFMYELIHHGLDSTTGRRVVERLNQMHHRWKIRNDDYRWILGTFAVLGIQTIDRHGWRPLTDHERQATIDWYRALGDRMGVTDIPTTYDAFLDVFTAYEHSTLRRTAPGLSLVAATLDIVMTDVPHPLRPAALQAAAVIIDEPARSSLGLPSPGRGVTVLTHLVLRVKASLRRLRAPRAPWFVPGAPQNDYPSATPWTTSDPAESCMLLKMKSLLPSRSVVREKFVSMLTMIRDAPAHFLSSGFPIWDGAGTATDYRSDDCEIGTTFRCRSAERDLLRQHAKEEGTPPSSSS